MGYIEHTISADLITWDHADGVCKLILVPRSEIDEDSDEPDAWDLLWIEASSNLRRTEIRLDAAYDRDSTLDGFDRETIARLASDAPPEALAILQPWID
jgi:hypothetical protein